MKIDPRYIKIAKGVLIVSMLILLWQFVRRVDPATVLASLVKAGPGLGWVVISTFVAYALGAWGWWYCLGDERKGIPKARLFMIRHVCETVGLFNPASFAGGDMLKVVLLKSYPISQPAVITSVMISRLLAVASQICLLFGTLLWCILQGRIQIPVGQLGYVIAFVAVAGALISGFFYWIRKSKHRHSGSTAPLSSFRAKLMTLLNEGWLKFMRFSRAHPSELRMAFLLFALHWLVGSLEFYIVIKLFGFEVSLFDGLILEMGVIAVKAAGAFVPGQIGVDELANKMMLSLIGIASIPLWISVSVLRRTRQLFWILVGAVFYTLLVRQKKIYA